MGAFEYTAVDAAGREKKGVLEGDTARQIRQTLRDQALLPVTVTEVAQTQRGDQAKTKISFKRGGGMSAGDLSLMTRQLATLVRSGLPLEEALQAVAEQTEKPRTKSTVLGVRAKVMEGHPLVDGLADFPQVFDELFRATVSAGEQSGHLDTILERLADYTENREQMRSKTLNAMIYPIFMFLFSVIVVVMLLTFVVPKIVTQFENSKVQLPMLTRMLMATSAFLLQWGWALALGLTLAIVMFVRWLRNPESRRKFHRSLLRTPLLGRVIRGTNTARFARTFSTLTSSAVPVLDALRISGQVVTNLPMRDAVEQAAVRVREGAAIGRSLAMTKIFPPMMIHLISSGETSGDLESMLDRAATNQEREMDAILSTAIGLLQPLMIVVMGGVVLVIVMAMLLPIFQLNSLIS
jgi:general secretion pathway protein F